MAGGLFEDGDDLAEAHEINVTPFIDVMLVLLIIFMVAAPLATVDVPVDLPGANVEAQQRPDRPVYLTLRADLSLALGERAIDGEALVPALDRETDSDREQRIYVRADKSVAYGELMGLMNRLRAAGYRKVALVGLEMRPAGEAGAP